MGLGKTFQSIVCMWALLTNGALGRRAGRRVVVEPVIVHQLAARIAKPAALQLLRSTALPQHLTAAGIQGNRPTCSRALVITPTSLVANWGGCWVQV